MVRSSLIENRIRFDSDKGPSGGMSDEDIDQDLQQDIAAAAAGVKGKDQGGTFDYSPDFDPSDRDTARAISASKAISDAASRGQGAVDFAQDVAAADPATRQALSRLANPYATNMAAVDQQLRSAAGSRPSTSTRTTGLDRSFFGDAYKDLYGGKPRGTTLNALLTGGPTLKLATGLFGTPLDTPTEQMAKSAGQMFSLARANMTPEEEAGLISGTNAMFDADTGTFSDVPIGGTGGTMSTGFLGGPVYSGMNDPNYSGPFERQVRGSSNDKDGDGPQTTNVFGQPTNTGVVNENAAAAGAIPSSELALNYLQNPYYAYSGFGNQYSPYGYANNTLVDLLQTRNLTQPGQADTLGLFGNPTDFS